MIVYEDDVYRVIQDRINKHIIIFENGKFIYHASLDENSKMLNKDEAVQYLNAVKLLRKAKV